MLSLTTLPVGLGVRVVKASRVFITPAERIRAVDGVTLDVSPGEFVCIHGASGSGKSTLLGLLAGLDGPDSGSIIVDGTDLSGLTESQRAGWRLTRIGVVFQHDNLIEEFTAAENVAFPLELRGRTQAEIDSEVEQMLAQVGLDGMADRWPQELSGGQQQRVGIARALAGGRGLLIADEPTAALDSTNSEALFALFKELSAQGVTVILASHDPLAHRFASRVVEMVDGGMREG